MQRADVARLIFSWGQQVIWIALFGMFFLKYLKSSGLIFWVPLSSNLSATCFSGYLVEICVCKQLILNYIHKFRIIDSTMFFTDFVLYVLNGFISYVTCRRDLPQDLEEGVLRALSMQALGQVLTYSLTLFMHLYEFMDPLIESIKLRYSFQSARLAPLSSLERSRFWTLVVVSPLYFFSLFPPLKVICS